MFTGVPVIPKELEALFGVAHGGLEAKASVQGIKNAWC